MQDLFYEESVLTQNERSEKTKYYVFKTFSVVSYVIAVVWGIVMLMTFPFGSGNVLINILFVLIPLALFIASGIIIGKFKDRFCVDYDYTFVSGSIRFSKIIKNVKRKNIIKFEVQSIEKIGYYGNSFFDRYSAMSGIKKHILTSNTEPAEGKNFYYMVVNSGGQKYLFVLECTETFLHNILKFSNRTIFDDEFFKKQK